MARRRTAARSAAVRGPALSIDRMRFKTCRPPFMCAPRKELEMALEANLLPVLKAAGLDGPYSLAGHSLFYDYHRRDGEIYRFLTIQFEKRGGPQFRLNFSEATATSIERRLRVRVTSDLLREASGELRGSRFPISSCSLGLAHKACDHDSEQRLLRPSRKEQPSCIPKSNVGAV